MITRIDNAIRELESDLAVTEKNIARRSSPRSGYLDSQASDLAKLHSQKVAYENAILYLQKKKTALQNNT